VVVPDIVVHFLEVPAIDARLRVESDDGSSEQVVAGADRSVVIRSGVACTEVDHAEVRVDGWRVPDPGAAVRRDFRCVRVSISWQRSGVAADIAWSRNGVKAPHDFSGSRIERRETSADSALTSGYARIDESVVIQRRRGDGVSLSPIFELRLP